MVFDKTGTLTVGKPERGQGVGEGEVRNPQVEGRKKAEEAKSEGSECVMHLAAALGQPSTHPVSQAVARLSAERTGAGGLAEVRGAGVHGAGRG